MLITVAVAIAFGHLLPYWHTSWNLNRQPALMFQCMLKYIIKRYDKILTSSSTYSIFSCPQNYFSSRSSSSSTHVFSHKIIYFEIWVLGMMYKLLFSIVGTVLWKGLAKKWRRWRPPLSNQTWVSCTIEHWKSKARIKGLRSGNFQSNKNSLWQSEF